MTKFLFVLAIIVAALVQSASSLKSRNLARKGKGSKKKGKKMAGRTLSLAVTNLSGGQPFSPFFVMVHNEYAYLYEFGEPSSAGLKTLAETGSPADLVAYFDGAEGVAFAGAHTEDAPLMPGMTTVIEVTVSDAYPLVTIASMGINTNDMFVSLNGEYLYPGDVLFSDGLDAGTEANDELCVNIPGPACGGGMGAPGGGEGFVHVSPGIHGGGDIAVAAYDWRNPVMKTAVYYPYDY